MTTHSTPIVELKGAKEALPKKDNHDLITLDGKYGWQKAFYETQHVHLEVDVEELKKQLRYFVIEDGDFEKIPFSGGKKFNQRRADTMAETLASTINKWARLVRK